MFNILSCLSHISFRVGLKIKFTMPYIFIDSQINYAVDIQASLVRHEHSRLSQSILSQKYTFPTSSRCFEIISLTRQTHLYLKDPGCVHNFRFVVTLKSSYSMQYAHKTLRQKKKLECDTRQQTKKFFSLYRRRRVIIMFKEMSTTRCGLHRQVN